MTRRPLTSTLSPPTPLSRPPPPYRELEPRGGAQLRAGHPAERAPARQPETLRLEQGEDEPAERLGRGHEVATGQHAARRAGPGPRDLQQMVSLDRKSTRLNSSHGYISYAVFCLKKKKDNINTL